MSNTDQNRIRELERQVKRLEQENAAFKKLINSKRFHFAEKIANGYNQLFPAGTLRGRATRKAGRIVGIVGAYKNRKRVRHLEKAMRRFDKIIILHSIPWNTPLRQRPHHLARCLSEQGFFVIYFEPDESITALRRISDSFYTCNSEQTILGLKTDPLKKHFFFFNNVSNLTLEQVTAFKAHGLNLVYEYIDEFHEDIAGPLTNQLDIWNHLKELQPALVLASANKLYADAKRHLGSDKHLLMSKNAVNVEDFDYRQFAGRELTSIQKTINSSRPIVGYYGSIAPWLDYDLIHAVAKQNPEYEFVYFGINYQDGLDLLDQSIKNIHYLGPKNYKELPAIAAQFDCAIIPFTTGEIAKGTSPVKLFEYMAAGLPTIGTKDLDECRGYDYVYLARNATQFGKFLHQAIEEHKDPKCRERLLEEANANSWTKRAEDIAKAINDLL